MSNNDLSDIPQLKANSKSAQLTYSSGKYGFTINNTFYEIGGGGMYPDFKNKITTLTLGPSNNYTVPKDCYLYGRGICTSGTRALKINGHSVAGCDSSNTSANLVSIPVQQGDVLSCEIALQSGTSTITELALYELL